MRCVRRRRVEKKTSVKSGQQKKTSPKHRSDKKGLRIVSNSRVLLSDTCLTTDRLRKASDGVPDRILVIY